MVLGDALFALICLLTCIFLLGILKVNSKTNESVLYDSEYDKEAPVVLDSRRLTSVELNKLLQSNDEMLIEYEVHLVSIIEDRVGLTWTNSVGNSSSSKSSNFMPKQQANPYKIPKFKPPTQYIPPPPSSNEIQVNSVNATTISNNIPKNGAKYVIQTNEIDALWDDDDDNDNNDVSKNNNICISNNGTEVAPPLPLKVEYSCYSSKEVISNSPELKIENENYNSNNGADVLPYDANFWDD